MPMMEIAVFPLEKESSPSIDEFVNSCIRISGEKGAKCEFTSTGVRIEGDKNALLEILVVTLRVNESNGNTITQAEI